MEFHLVAERSEARQWIVAIVDCSATSVVLQSTVVLQSGCQRQGGKEKDRKRDGLGVRERERYN